MNKKKLKSTARKIDLVTTYPLFCDFSCEYADFAAPDAVGACRRDVGVWCKKAKRYNTKHAKCVLV